MSQHDLPDPHYPRPTLEVTVLQAIASHQRLVELAEHVALLIGYGCDRVSFESVNPDADATFTTYWEESWNFGGHESREGYIPVRYLWMSNEDIQADQAVKKAEAEEYVRQANIREAELRLQTARDNVARAQAEAEGKLAEAEAELARIKGAAP